MKTFQDRFVSLRDEAGGGDGGGAGAGAGGGVDAAALAAELADLKKTVAAKDSELATAKQTITEKDQAAQFWHEKATKGATAAKAAEADPADEVDLLDVIGTKGTKGLDAVLKARGYVSKDDVQALIADTVQTVSREGKAVERFPELKDKDSDFYKQTAKNVAALAKDGIKGVAATELAAERTYLQFLDEGKMKPAAVRRAEAEKHVDDDEDEQDRIARGAAAGGATGRRASTPASRRAAETAEDKNLRKRVCAAFEIDEDKYIKRAEEIGVNIGR